MTVRLTGARRALLVALATGFAISFTAMSTPANAAMPTDPPNDKIVIDVVTANGSGCPGDSADIAVSPDNTAFTVLYSEYIAQVGVGAKPTDFRKNCQLVLHVHVPQGFTYAIAEANYRGFASTAKGAKAEQRAHYYFQGFPQTAHTNYKIGSNFEDTWQNDDVTEVAQYVYHPCGENRYFNINTELRALRGSSNIRKTTSFITMDSTDGSIKTKYHFHWKKCKR